jgi:hypothetical protein
MLWNRVQHCALAGEIHFEYDSNYASKGATSLANG